MTIDAEYEAGEALVWQEADEGEGINYDELEQHLHDLRMRNTPDFAEHYSEGDDIEDRRRGS